MSKSPAIPEWEQLGIPHVKSEPEDAGVEHIEDAE